MSGYVWRRSGLSLGLLAALLVLGGTVLVAVGLPVWAPALLSVGLLAAQYVWGPRLIEWLVPAREVPRLTDGYATDHPVGELLARRCREAGLPLVRLGVVDDGTPNAFTFGHSRRDARVWVSRGLLERLDDDELDAVLCHELGHVRQNDFVVMALAALVPMVLYWPTSGCAAATTSAPSCRRSASTSATSPHSSRCSPCRGRASSGPTTTAAGRRATAMRCAARW